MKLNGYKGTILPGQGMFYENGKTDYRILIPENASESNRFAARELTDIFAKAGVGIETVTDKGLEADPAKKFISLGRTVYFDALDVKMTQREYKFDGFLIESVGETVVICGVGDTGTCFGAYGFAEYACGWVYYAKDEYKVEKAAKKLEFHIKDVPSFIGRYAFSTYTSHDMDHAFRLRVNGEFSHREARHGEGTPWSTLTDISLATQLMDFRKYWDGHPHWFVRNPDWLKLAKAPGTPQICFSRGLYDEEFYQTLLHNLIENFIVPEKDKVFFLLGISDNRVVCNCADCLRETARYGRSGLSMRLINRIARDVETWRRKNAPDRLIYVMTFAYLTTFDPPVKEENGAFVPVDESVVAEDNVAVRWAPLYANFIYPLTDPVHNETSARSLQGWRAVAKNLSVWDYRQDFGTPAFPFPSAHTAQENMDTYFQAGMLDVFNQGQHWCEGSPFIPADDFARARMHWNMNESYEDLFEEFCRAYYRTACDAVLEYRRAIEAYYPVMVQRGWNGVQNNRAVLRPKYHTPEEMRAFLAILDRGLAEAAKIPDPDLRKKVELRVRTLTLFPKFVLAICFADRIPPEEVLSLVADLRALCAETGFDALTRKKNGLITPEEYLAESEAIARGTLAPSDRKYQLWD